MRCKVLTSRVARSISPIPASSLAATSEHPCTPKRAVVSRKNPPPASPSPDSHRVASPPFWDASVSRAAGAWYSPPPRPPDMPFPGHPLPPAGCRKKLGLCGGEQQARDTFAVGPGEEVEGGREKQQDEKADRAQEGGIQHRESITKILDAVARACIVVSCGMKSLIGEGGEEKKRRRRIPPEDRKELMVFFVSTFDKSDFWRGAQLTNAGQHERLRDGSRGFQGRFSGQPGRTRTR